MCIDTERFERARGRVIGIERQRLGIGTLSEKTVHARIIMHRMRICMRSRLRILLRIFLTGRQ